MLCDLHIHSKYSYDSIMEPKKILAKYVKKGYTTIAITDHNSIKGSLEAKKYEEKFNVHVLLGEEILTDVGDIIGLNINEEIKNKTWGDVIDEIHAQGGIAILPHPYRGHTEIQKVAKKVDLIEAWNSRNKPLANIKALKLAKELQKPIVGGSDAHLYSEIGNMQMYCNDLFDSKKQFKITYSKKYEIFSSILIKDIRTKNFQDILKILTKKRKRKGD